MSFSCLSRSSSNTEGVEISLVTVHVLTTNLLWVANHKRIPGEICVYFSGADILTLFKLRQNPSGFNLTLERFAQRFRRVHNLIEGVSVRTSSKTAGTC